jgi:hypothetical protein
MLMGAVPEAGLLVFIARTFSRCPDFWVFEISRGVTAWIYKLMLGYGLVLPSGSDDFLQLAAGVMSVTLENE